MSATAAFSRAWRVGKRTVTLSLPMNPAGLMHAVIEWEPSVPRRLSRAELREYREGRARALCELAAETGRRIAVVDL